MEQDAVEMPPTQIERALRELHRLDSGAIAAGQGAYRARIFDGAGPPGERAARGRGDDDRASQRIPGNRVSALGGTTWWWRRPMPKTPIGRWKRARSGGDPEPRRNRGGEPMITPCGRIGKIYQIDRRDIQVGMRKALGARGGAIGRFGGSSIPRSLCARLYLRRCAPSFQQRSRSAQTRRAPRPRQDQ